MTFQASDKQKAVWDFLENGKGSAVIEAVAGSGKTTTIVKGLERMPSTLRMVFLAFNKSIAEELKERVPSNVMARTFNSLGWAAVKKRFNLNPSDIEGNKVRRLAREIMTEDEDDLFDEVVKLVSLSKAFGMVPATTGLRGRFSDKEDNWYGLISRFDLDVDADDLGLVVKRAREVASASAKETDKVDYDDQLLFPLIYDIRMPRFDVVFVDEAQDVSFVQLAMLGKILRAGGRLVAVGDTHQAIYGFRGADSASMARIGERFDAKTLPLSITYRCARNIVRMAQTVMPSIEPAEKAPDGDVYGLASYGASDFTAEDMVVCRNTAPLVALCYRLIGNGNPARVLGKDIGAGMKALIKKLKPKGVYGVHGLREKLDAWEKKERAKWIEKDKEDKADAVTDRADTLRTIIDALERRLGGGKVTVPAVEDEIDALFEGKDKDTRPRTTLCTVHKSKGLEADRVFVLDPFLMPSQRATQDWQKAQEDNLIYVAYTRAKSALVFIRSSDFESDTKRAASSAGAA